MAAAGTAVLVLAAVVADAVAQAVLGRPPTGAGAPASPLAFPGNNLLLAALIPLSWAALRVGHGIAPRWQAAVVGRTRWRWMLLPGLLPAVVVAVSVLGLGLLALAAGEQPLGSGDGRSAASTALLVVVVLLTTPLQAAGEEHFFGGWMSQAVGSRSAHPAAGAVAAALVSAAAFAFARGDQDPGCSPTGPSSGSRPPPRRGGPVGWRRGSPSTGWTTWSSSSRRCWRAGGRARRRAGDDVGLPGAGAPGRRRLRGDRPPVDVARPSEGPGSALGPTSGRVFPRRGHARRSAGRIEGQCQCFDHRG